MDNQDDIAIIQALGYVAIYSAYLEESMFDLITLVKNYIPLKNNIPQYHLADQAKHLRKALKTRFHEKLTAKNDEHYYIIGILNDVEKIAKERNEMLHSIVKAFPDGRVNLVNPHNNISKELIYENVKSLADDLFDLRTAVLRIYHDGRFKRLLVSYEEKNDSFYRRLEIKINNIFKWLLAYFKKYGANNMSTFLETKRLILKTTELSDLGNLVALRSDPDVIKYIGKCGATQTKEEIEKFLTMAIEHQKKHGFGFCSVFKKDTGAYIGHAGLIYIGLEDPQHDQVNIEIAMQIYKHFWHEYATELARALIQWGFQHLPNKRLIALIDPQYNRSARRVLDNVGMNYPGKVIYNNEEVPCYEIYKSDSIKLVPYDTQWPEMAASEITKLREILPPEHIIDMQHVGSTAIPRMSAKPIIDIQIAVDSLPAIKQAAIDTLKTLGYEYWYDNPDTERMFFVKGMPPFGEKRTHHVHIVEPTSRHWQGKILFRDYLIAHSEAANEYESLKIKLAEEFANEREQYTEGKTQFVNRILEKAKLNK